MLTTLTSPISNDVSKAISSLIFNLIITIFLVIIWTSTSLDKNLSNIFKKWYLSVKHFIKVTYIYKDFSRLSQMLKIYAHKQYFLH